MRAVGDAGLGTHVSPNVAARPRQRDCNTLSQGLEVPWALLPTCHRHSMQQHADCCRVSPEQRATSHLRLPHIFTVKAAGVGKPGRAQHQMERNASWQPRFPTTIYLVDLCVLECSLDDCSPSSTFSLFAYFSFSLNLPSVPSTLVTSFSSPPRYPRSILLPPTPS